MLKFAPFVSHFELPFYASLAAQKIDHDKLDDTPRKILGSYEIRPHDPPEASCRLQVDGSAFTSDVAPEGCYRAEGLIKNFNTIEEYKNADKPATLSEAATTIWEAILDGTVCSRPSILASFYVLSFADLKKYKFTYLTAFPALHSNPVWKIMNKPELTEKGLGFLQEGGIVHPTKDERAAIHSAIGSWRDGVDAIQHGFFLAKRPGVNADARVQASRWIIGTLAEYERGFFDGVAADECFFGFADPSTYATNPGWMLRNLLLLIRQRWKLKSVQVLCYRDIAGDYGDVSSIILPLKQEDVSKDAEAVEKSASDLPAMPKSTGWERNNAGKIVNRIANLGEHLDPKRLADQAVDLNLKLIKWRIAPKINLDKVKQTKCLLLGAGTLGSYVARNLLGWGVQKITFIDNGTVSYSNPVRQPLYGYQDCVGGATKKATRAAEALKEIFPGVDSKGYDLSVPMPGHTILDESATRTEFETLRELIKEHDVVCLLMDSRESRWLPTMLGKAEGKIVLNSALGFDTYVVMRHGMFSATGDRAEELGCYFCNDVVAPSDSMSDRTLDQQCTVTRPGLAAIASALLVELLVSVLQHPNGAAAPAATRPSEGRDEHPLGIVPHQIRGFLSNFENVLIKGQSYESCSACSQRIVTAYKTDGWDFVKRALNEPGYVEELSGLAEVQRTAEQAMAEMDLSEGDEEALDEEGELV